MDTVIRTEGLSKRYGEVAALDGLDLEVPRNSIFGFLGANGAGKSTTMKLLLGLAAPSSGSGSVFGLDIVRDSVAVRRRVGYLAQEPRFYDYMSASDTLMFVSGFFPGALDGNRRERVREALELVGLEAKASRQVGGFSGGERQRLGIAQAWIHEPDLLILDEPAASLDPMGREDVLNILRKLRDRATVFYSTHILDDVQRVSDRVAIVDRGKLVAQAPIEQLLLAREGTGYSVVLEGASERLRQRLEGLPWVSALSAAKVARGESWSIAVSDAEAAERSLLRELLRDESVRVLEYRLHVQELEDVFLELVNRGNASE